MKNKTYFEPAILILIFVLYQFLINEYLFSLIYLVIIITISIYFFPLKLISIFKNNVSDKVFKISSAFVIAAILHISYISFVLPEYSNAFKLCILFFTLVNLFLLYTFSNKKNNIKYLHIIMLFFLTAIYMKNIL